MAKRTGKRAAAPPKEDRGWFERKVAELKTELEKLPADRQEQLKREMEVDEDLLDTVRVLPARGTELKQTKKGGK